MSECQSRAVPSFGEIEVKASLSRLPCKLSLWRILNHTLVYEELEILIIQSEAANPAKLSIFEQ